MRHLLIGLMIASLSLPTGCKPAIHRDPKRTQNQQQNAKQVSYIADVKEEHVIEIDGRKYTVSELDHYDPSLPIILIPRGMLAEKGVSFSLIDSDTEKVIIGVVVAAIALPVIGIALHSIFIKTGGSGRQPTSDFEPQKKISAATPTQGETTVSLDSVLPSEGTRDLSIGKSPEKPPELITPHEAAEASLNRPIVAVTDASGTAATKVQLAVVEDGPMRVANPEPIFKRIDSVKEGSLPFLEEIKKADTKQLNQDIEVLFQKIDEIDEIKKKIKITSPEKLSAEEARVKELTTKEKELWEEVSRKRSILLASDLSKENEYQPVASLAVSGRTFYLSKILRGRQRDFAVFYTANADGHFVARLMYKSKSDGGWKVVPFVWPNGQMSKGQGIHYTQETKPIPEIISTMEKLEEESLWVRPLKEPSNLFMVSKAAEPGYTRQFSKEVSEPQLQTVVLDAMAAIRKCQPGYCFGDEGLQKQDLEKLHTAINEQLRSKELKGFMPDFKSQPPITSYKFSHTLLGETTVDVYRGTLGEKKVHWHMASDSSGLIWIERISFEDSPISSYGVASQFLDSGVLTNKPLEYIHQASGLRKVKYDDGRVGAVYFDREYDDITGFLDQLLPIQAYREASGIKRK